MAYLLFLLCEIALALCVILPFIISWAAINVLVWLISLCFGLSYSIAIGTGIWLLYLLIHCICE